MRHGDLELMGMVLLVAAEAPPAQHKFTQVTVASKFTLDIPAFFCVTGEWSISENFGLRSAFIAPPSKAKAAKELKFKSFSAFAEVAGFVDWAPVVPQRSRRMRGMSRPRAMWARRQPLPPPQPPLRALQTPGSVLRVWSLRPGRGWRAGAARLRSQRARSPHRRRRGRPSAPLSSR